MFERLLTTGVPSMYGTATRVPNDTSFIGAGRGGGGFETKPITITTEAFVISKPTQPRLPLSIILHHKCS